MDSKKNVKLLVLLFVLVLAAALAFGMIPKEDVQGKLRGVNRTDNLIPSFRVGNYTQTDDIMNRGGTRENLAIIPHIRDDYAATDDIRSGSISY